MEVVGAQYYICTYIYIYIYMCLNRILNSHTTIVGYLDPLGTVALAAPTAASETVDSQASLIFTSS